ncbi:glycosyltransferase family 61 protein [Spirosoma sp. KUDC1026]|uniref:glycosyltransferase family 61 protein n=1 Tax=Spirosoma sp. KUDC1026 TaxID=2745947 RepID=UPI00159BB16B|nr:glycosyltransferase family 61 protein [Spirosoma sp. KUDC1026]QKZ11393.1 glycosyltransferase family 61 protein [Spirosoma sp. KUDC1026]
MESFLTIVKRNIKNQSKFVAKCLGVELLSWNETKNILKIYSVKREEEKEYVLPEIYDIVDNTKLIFPEKRITTPETYAWKCDTKESNAILLKNGSIMIGKSILDTDFGNLIALKDKLKTDKRNVIRTNLLIAPWSHYWSGYYDYIYFVITKLIRLKAVMSESEWNRAVIAYPLMHSTFEKELLALLDISPEQIVDSRTTKVSAETCLLGNNGSWFYPSSTDILSLKRAFQNKFQPGTSTDKRIYISRAGRRKINNEPSLIKILEKYNFTIIEDKARTIAEQAEIYYNAAVIIGPHGASFANIIWCKPGAHLIELFPVNYMPEYFRYLAHVLGLNYSAYCFHSVLKHGLVDHTYVNDNVDVNVEDIDRFLSSLLKSSQGLY